MAKLVKELFDFFHPLCNLVQSKQQNKTILQLRVKRILIQINGKT